MDKTGSGVPNEKLNAWIKQTMDSAVHHLMDLGLAESVIVEAKPAWVFPFTLLIGRLREHGQLGGFDWFICGDAPTSHLSSTVAATPREAARHFALQWQIDAARQGEAGEELARKAEALYELTEKQGLWQQQE